MAESVRVSRAQKSIEQIFFLFLSFISLFFFIFRIPIIFLSIDAKLRLNKFALCQAFFFLCVPLLFNSLFAFSSSVWFFSLIILFMLLFFFFKLRFQSISAFNAIFTVKCFQANASIFIQITIFSLSFPLISLHSHSFHLINEPAFIVSYFKLKEENEHKKNGKCIISLSGFHRYIEETIEPRKINKKIKQRIFSIVVMIVRCKWQV